MKSMSVLFLAAAVLGLWFAGAHAERTGRGQLVSDTVAAGSWTRTCGYFAAGGVKRVEIDAAERCPGTAPAVGAVREARLKP